MQVSRDDTGHALIVLTVDSSVPGAAIDTIIERIGAHSGRFVDMA